MKKRIGILVLVLSLVLSVMVLATAAQEPTPMHRAAYAGNAAADGTLSELYLFYGAGGAFDALWADDTLYLAVKTGGEALSVTLNGSYTFTGSGDPVELAIPFSDFCLNLTDYSQTVPMKLTLGETVA